MLVAMDAVSFSTYAFSLEWQDILYILRLALVAKLGRWLKYHGIC